jgi:hypothetical protein
MKTETLKILKENILNNLNYKLNLLEQIDLENRIKQSADQIHIESLDQKRIIKILKENILNNFKHKLDFLEQVYLENYIDNSVDIIMKKNSQ